ncbi:MAG: hypothetical protein LBM96_07745 [Methanobrevibacter sp.]|jgi:hypothetical protein|nr:hypothetical protein [Candidatus Methanoflexus mossambicus]
MKSEAVLRSEVMKSLIKNFGLVDAERFIDIIKRDEFDYTEWQKDLWKDKTTTEIHNEAKQYYLEKKENKN